MRPWLVIVTGEPGSGKTTLCQQIAARLRTPFLARDAVRGGMLATAGIWRGELATRQPRETAVEAFVQIVETMARTGTSAVVELVVSGGRDSALRRLTEAANCLVVLLEATDARTRAEKRDHADPLLNRPGVVEALGFATIDDFINQPQGDHVRATMRTEFDLPTLRVRSDDGFEPALPSIVEWVVDQTRP